MQLIHYDAAFKELMAAESVDEVKEIRDKAIALEAYAKQAMNTDMERAAVNIRIRAERKAGQMLKDLNPGRGGNNNPEGSNQHVSRPKGHSEPLTSEYAQAKQSANISDTQAKRWQQLADVEDDTFEEIMEDSEKLSTNRIINKEKQIDSDIIWLMGRLRDFERHKINNLQPEKIVDLMTPEMMVRAGTQIPFVIGFLKDIEESLHGKSTDRPIN